MEHMHHHHQAMGPSGLASFLLFGLLSSLHCFAMCGPLSAAFIANSKSKFYLPLLTYHFTRIAAYMLIAIPLQLIGLKLKAYVGLTALLVAVAILFAFNLAGLQMPKLPGLKLPIIAAKLSPSWRAMLLATITPLLPCGLLYAIYASILLAPNWYQAMLWMMAFGLGSAPLLLASQLGFHQIAARLKNSQLFFMLLGILALVGFLLMPLMHG